MLQGSTFFMRNQSCPASPFVQIRADCNVTLDKRNYNQNFRLNPALAQSCLLEASPGITVKLVVAADCSSAIPPGEGTLERLNILLKFVIY